MRVLAENHLKALALENDKDKQHGVCCVAGEYVLRRDRDHIADFRFTNLFY